MLRVLPRLGFLAATALLSVAPAAAQDLMASHTMTRAVLFPVAPVVVPAAGAASPTTAVAREQATAGLRGTRDVTSFNGFERPSLLPALYASQVALQALDFHSTYTAIDRGAREANPVMKGVVGNRGAMLAVKAGVAASTIWMSEKLWRRGNRAGAIALMAIVNGVTAAVVAHNYRVASQLR
jgi:Domain of unknown function (DUF5658)